MSRTIPLAAAVIMAAAAGAAFGREGVADDRPFAIPVTAAGFGNLAGYEGGNAGGERGQANWLDRSGPDYGRYVGAGVTPTFGAPQPSPALRRYEAVPLRPDPRSTTGRSSYDARPRTAYVMPVVVEPVAATRYGGPVYVAPCRCR